MIEVFIPCNFHPKTRELIHLCNEIINKMEARGYRLTLRQLYYRLVAADVIANKQTEYKRLGEIVNSARLAGLIDWDAIEDRTRNLRGTSHHYDPADIVRTAANSFRLDKWENQSNRVEVWVEKDALVGVVQKACTPLDVDYFSCRGYTSQSEMYAAAQRLKGYVDAGQQVTILHFGDHDPSGVDMTRDILDRIEMFSGGMIGQSDISIDRVALNMDQVRKYNPPPNPAKQTDSRFKAYRRKHGANCWELDALDVGVIDQDITQKVISLREDKAWNKAVEEETKCRADIQACADRWGDVHKFLNKPKPKPRQPRRKKK